MPVPATSVDFLSLVRKSGVVAPASLSAFEQQFASGPPQDPKQTRNRHGS